MIGLAEHFLNEIPQWLTGSDGVALSGRIRLVRNLNEFPFATFANAVQKKAIREKVFSALEDFFKRRNMKVKFSFVEELSKKEIDILRGLRFINSSSRKNIQGIGICLSWNGRISVLVNDTDHIKIHLYSENLSYNEIYEDANAIEDFLIENLNISFSEELGFLTACPTNIGTALRISSMLHIPSIVATGEINDIARFLSRKDIVLRGLFGREETYGDIFQLSNTVTLGKTEEEIIGEVYKVSLQLVKREEELREKLMSSALEEVQDKVNKSMGIVNYAKFLSLEEAFEIVSLFRMTKLAGLLPELTLKSLNEALLRISPELIRAENPDIQSSQEENKLRAELLRKIFK